jgi:ribosome biogenesis protein BMS1
VTFEDKVLLSDVVFLRAWARVEVPRFCSPVTNLLAPRAAPAPRAPKGGRNRKVAEAEAAGDGYGGADGGDEAAAGLGVGAAAAGARADVAAAEAAAEFRPAARFGGARPGTVFKLGAQGLGYYADVGVDAAGAAGGADAAGAATGANGGALGGAGAAAGAAAASGWVAMRSVAELRRAAGVGAPRLSDSLYRPIERAPRRFNPLRVPAALQAALPFKSKPKTEAPRRRPSLEQRRAVVLEPAEKKRATLLAQLNAIRNAKAGARRDARARQQDKLAKRGAEEEAWRARHAKEERKKRYVEAGQAEKRAAKRPRGGGRAGGRGGRDD